jgi:hypothetical protein
MDAKQRFRLTMKSGEPDRAPLFEEGIREEVLKTWRGQGLNDRGLSDLFLYDWREEIEPNLDPEPYPRIWPARLADLDSFAQRLDPHDPKRLPAGWKARVDTWRERDHPLLLRVHHGYFLTMGVEEWDRFVDSLYLLHDNPALVHGLLELQAEFAAELVDKILSQVEVDAALFSEPIGGAHGPLVSPRTYQEFVIRSYQPILGVLHRHGVETIIMRTYANTRALLPAWVEAGFNCLWACECGPGAMDYHEIRAEYGSELRLIGGIDTDWLYQDAYTIQQKLWEVLPALLQQGGYIPLADGRVRVEVPFQNYVTYRLLLEELVKDSQS